MSRTSYLAKNIGLLTISQFGTKLLSFFLLPLYTSILTTADYGTFDLFSTTVSLLIPVLTLGISSGVLRYAMEKECDKAEVFSYGLKYFFTSSLIVLVLVILNYLFGFNEIIKHQSLLVFLLFLSTNLNGIVSSFTRGLENIKAIAIAGVFCTLVTALLNIVFLIPLHMGLTGYLLAHILGSFFQISFLFFATRLWKYISFKKGSPDLKKNMLSYSKPLVANDISWWVNNVSDRYIVTWLCGISENGIYSVGYKIPSALTMLQNIFAQAWTLSAIKDFGSEDSARYFSKMYALYNFAMTAVCSVLIITTRFFARLLYAKDFFEAWKYVPFLLISVVFGALAGYVGAIFGAAKDTKVFAYSSVAGAVVNIVLNIALVWRFGVIGAAIATAVSYCVIWVLRMVRVRNYVALKINTLRDVVCYAVLLVQAVLLLRFMDSYFLYIAEFGLLVLIVLMNFSVLKMLYKKSIKKISRKQDLVSAEDEK